MKHSRVFFGLSAALICVLALLHYTGFIWYNTIFARPYKVKGLDVSNHQGEIDWSKVASTGTYKFVYIKATEGHDFTDDFFKSNWHRAKAEGLYVGAYHFFSSRSKGKQQAELFTSLVPVDVNALPPVIDVEIDIDKDKEQIQHELAEMITVLEKRYHKSPILYVTYETYEAYVRGYFLSNRIWIRDIFKAPFLADRDWSLWQYNNRGRITGIESYVDINVFSGDQHNWDDFVKR
jgi:lysozyme